MSKELRSSFKTIFLVAMVVVTSLYIGFGVCGYLSFGPDTEAIITLNLPAGDRGRVSPSPYFTLSFLSPSPPPPLPLSGIFPFIVKGFLCFSLYFTYPSKHTPPPSHTHLLHSPSLPPVMMFPVSSILERMFFSGTSNTNYLLGVSSMDTSIISLSPSPREGGRGRESGIL